MITTAHLNAAADAMAALITHIGLIDDEGTEVTGGSYARQAVTWESAVGGEIYPTADLTFDIPASGTVAGWRGYSALTAGTDYGGQALAERSFTVADEYVLEADKTAYVYEVKA